jgi:lipoate-protein ligase A
MTEEQLWQFENTGLRAGVFNMEYDRRLAEELLQKDGRPTVRVYGWQPRAISYGWNQSPDEIDAGAAKAHNVDIVRRPTGGRAILHADELTYSVVMRVRQKNILTVYKEISSALLAALAALGADAAMEKTQPDFPALYRTHSAAACFSSAGRYEIKCRGKKIIGSAQRRYRSENGEEIVLQHGSLLLGPGHKKITDFLSFSADSDREILRLELEEKTTDLSAELHRDVAFDEAAEAVRKGFEQAWDIQFYLK